jgi:Tfp pilus assembly protein PilF
VIERLERLLASGSDSALLRFSLGNAYLTRDPRLAATHLQRAVELDPDYSAAWKLLGRAQAQAQQLSASAASYRQGIAVAERRGDIQAAKEMRVFLKRLEKSGIDLN